MSIVSTLFIARQPVIAYGALGLIWGAFSALAPVIKAQVGAGDAEFGVMLTGTAFGLASTMWLAPRFDERMGRFSLPSTVAMLALAFLLPGFAATPFALFLSMTVVGLSSGLLDVVMNTRVAELEAHHQKPIMNVTHGAVSFGYALGAFLTGLAREYGYGPQDVLPFFSFILLLLVQSTIIAQQPVVGTLQEMRPNYSVVALCAGLVVIAFGAQAVVEAWSALHVERSLGGRAALGALAPALLGLTMGIGRFWGHYLVLYCPDLRLIEAAGIVTVLGALLAALASTPQLAVIGFALLGLGVSVIGPLAISRAGAMSHPAARSRAIALVAVLGYLAFFLAPAAFGMVVSALDLQSGFLVVAACLCLIPLLTIALKGSPSGR